MIESTVGGPTIAEAIGRICALPGLSRHILLSTVDELDTVATHLGMTPGQLLATVRPEAGDASHAPGCGTH